MRQMILFVIVLVLLPSSLSGQLPSRGYIGLFTDDDHSIWCAQGTGFYPVEI